MSAFVELNMEQTFCESGKLGMSFPVIVLILRNVFLYLSYKGQEGGRGDGGREGRRWDGGRGGRKGGGEGGREGGREGRDFLLLKCTTCITLNTYQGISVPVASER